MELTAWRRIKENHLQTLIRSQFTLAVGLLFIPLFSGAARAATIPLTRCGQITQPGSYHLVQDLVADSLICIEVLQANDVEMHLDGYTIRGGIAIMVRDASNVSITGSGTIETPGFGIYVRGGTGLKVVGVTIRSSALSGNGVRLELLGGATVIGNTIVNTDVTNTAGGIVMLGAKDSIIRSNTVSGFFSGIIAAGSDGNLLQSNTVSSIQFDLRDQSGCGANTWKSNTFTTSFGCF